MASKSGIWYMDYQPSLTEIVGNERAKKSFLAWFGHRLDPSKKSTREMDQKNCGLLYGPPGTGKTALVRAAARELGVMLIELDASELRNKEGSQQAVGRAEQESNAVRGDQESVADR